MLTYEHHQNTTTAVWYLNRYCGSINRYEWHRCRYPERLSKPGYHPHPYVTVIKAAYEITYIHSVMDITKIRLLTFSPATKVVLYQPKMITTTTYRRWSCLLNCTGRPWPSFKAVMNIYCSISVHTISCGYHPTLVACRRLDRHVRENKLNIKRPFWVIALSSSRCIIGNMTKSTYVRPLCVS